MFNSTQLLPRLIRHRDAHFYLGMDKNRFNKEVRPHLSEIPIGIQGIAFDRLDLDAWVEQYKSRNGRLKNTSRGGTLWDAKDRQGSLKEETPGILTNKSLEKEFERALAQAASKKRKNT